MSNEILPPEENSEIPSSENSLPQENQKTDDEIVEGIVKHEYEPAISKEPVNMRWWVGNSDKDKTIIQIPKNSEEHVLVRPTKPMTTKEILAEMEKQGIKPTTTDDLIDFNEKITGIIEPKDTDIVVEPKPKELPE